MGKAMIGAVAALVLAGAAGAQGPGPLVARGLDPALLLPPPPARGSAAEARELGEVRAIIAAASPAEKAQARYDDTHEDPSLFDATIAPGFSLRQHPHVWALLTRVQGEADAAASLAKVHFGRTRPWGLDASLVPCDARPGAKPTRSYPSGHAMLGYAVGLVLADLLPDRAPAILTRADQYAFERLVCADHFASDVEASHALAGIVVTRLEAVPAFRAERDAARAELRAAGLGRAGSRDGTDDPRP